MIISPRWHSQYSSRRAGEGADDHLHSYPRAARVNELLREVVSEEIERLADVDERLRMLTVTAVLSEQDLSRATVLLSSAPAQALQGLQAQRRRLQRAVADQARLRRTPRLGFAADPSVAAGERVDAAIRRLHAADQPDLESGVRGAHSHQESSDIQDRDSAQPREVALRGLGSERSAVSGVVVVDKEAGWTSHDVVARCRKIFGLKRVGHAGTLDPDATGVLVVGLGRATRLLRFTGSQPKTYEADVVLGVGTSTLDSSGDVVAEIDMSEVPIDEVRAAAAALTGSILQVPPMVSALKVGGRRLHELAREGIEVEREARRVEVSRFDVDLAPEGRTTKGTQVLQIKVTCSSGTYVRSLAADLGALLGGCAHVRSLRRTSAGAFSLDEARRVGELSIADVLPPAAAMRGYTSVTVGPQEAAKVRSGRLLDRSDLQLSGDGPWSLLDALGDLLAVYGERGPDMVAPIVVLATPGDAPGTGGLG
jgi:tRNA pseudouridine55 synthase